MRSRPDRADARNGVIFSLKCLGQARTDEALLRGLTEHPSYNLEGGTFQLRKLFDNREVITQRNDLRHRTICGPRAMELPSLLNECCTLVAARRKIQWRVNLACNMNR